ncbi:hypothetical protein [Lysobacter capsici]|uniref:hypothetical protein n=1 Tax=Lysobacter capsici TaxID=435897 RepID=UPI00398CF6AA
MSGRDALHGVGENRADQTFLAEHALPLLGNAPDLPAGQRPIPQRDRAILHAVTLIQALRLRPRVKRECLGAQAGVDQPGRKRGRVDRVVERLVRHA